MNNQERIQIAFKSAVKGLKEEWFISNSNEWYNYIISLPVPEKLTYLILICNNEVYNGGFDQYFINGYGQFAKETIAAFELIGAPLKASLVKDVYEKINSKNIDDKEFRSKIFNKEMIDVIDSVGDQLEVLDNLYYATENSEDLEQLLGIFLRKF
ncbi:MAG: DMP19 family protein [Sphingobacteriales bacterium JAD_PAG50586_3]|nr:MAG: DMP19 family protein [Sphingobacteriales bacterium JAD_PAG50586_3]